MTTYIYNQSAWPNFIWEPEKVTDLLINLRFLQGRIIGSMEAIGFEVRKETILDSITQDVVKSSEIEGKYLNQLQVRSSVARHLGMDMDIAGINFIDRNIEGIVEMMLDATQNYNHPLTKKRLLSWHASLFPTGYSDMKKIKTGSYRTSPVEVISGHISRNKEVIHFEGPPPERVEYEMKLFLDWVNHENNMDVLLKAAIAHFWFLTIHPFDDGNGRIGRAIADYLLAKSENSPRRFYSLSAQIQKERKGYYLILENTQKGKIDITAWIKWFFNCLSRSIEEALSKLTVVINKGQFWESLGSISLNERQKKIINMMLDGFSGNLTSSKWAKINKCSQDSAYRDILDLIEKKILVKNNEGGRSTSYALLIKN